MAATGPSDIPNAGEQAFSVEPYLVPVYAMDLKLLGYSLDLFSTPQAAGLLQQLDAVIGERAIQEYEEMLALVEHGQAGIEPSSESASYQYMFLPMGEGMV
ncbi:hypothetical protein FB45DRAFT_1035251 [Roridomyces roridus]|uniref:Uncharacterized protein n=1 Tax=Roridomyces roridus TaxID=1738132 RepID=A0AAD7BB99_9AGAR|nr:hypothetical protein FB45DRAFT_1035251 [Roridomyces roridus]